MQSVDIELHIIMTWALLLLVLFNAVIPEENSPIPDQLKVSVIIFSDEKNIKEDIEVKNKSYHLYLLFWEVAMLAHNKIVITNNSIILVLRG